MLDKLIFSLIKFIMFVNIPVFRLKINTRMINSLDFDFFTFFILTLLCLARIFLISCALRTGFNLMKKK